MSVKLPPATKSSRPGSQRDLTATSQSMGSRGRASSAESDNPFVVPSEEEVFILRDKERQRKHEERLRFQNMSIMEKTMRNTRDIVLRSRGSDEDLELTEEDLKREAAMNQSMDPLLLSKKNDTGMPKEKENLAEYIAKKRQMFLVQMSLDAKRAEIRNLEEKAAERERKLRFDEEMLEENAQKFDEFLKNNDMKAVEAMRKAEEQTKAKSEKVSEIKRLNAQIQAIKSQMSTDEEKLEEWRRYKDFLLSLTPDDWKRDQREQLRRVKYQKAVEEWEASQLPSAAFPSAGGSSSDKDRPKSSDTKQGGKRKVSSRMGTGSRDRPRLEDITVDDSELPMYFTDPQQLLDIFGSLEESNLFLIQNSQETEEALEEVRHKYNDARRRLEQETTVLSGQISTLQTSIDHEREKADAFGRKAQVNVSTNSADRLLRGLNAKVLEVYTQAGFENDAKLSTLDMLRNIEMKLEELISEAEKMAPEVIEAAEKAREKERRHRIREEKLEEARRQQEERIKRALERSQAPVQRRTGKPVMFRSHVNTDGATDGTQTKRERKSTSLEGSDNDLTKREDYREFFE